MIQSKQDYIDTLKEELKTVPHADEILDEIDLHLDDVLEDILCNQNVTETEAMEKLLERVGSPKELAAMYRQEFEVTPAKTQWTFISTNLIFFIIGIGLTIVYHLVPLTITNELWGFLTSIPTVIMVLYMVFWGLLGYEIGKEFGFGGRKLLYRTFYITLLPNLILMALVVFRVIPLGWFDPLLSQPFIIACILCTIILYPISYTGFRWGILRSL
ncbi:hypothetical protein KS407_05555 [Bacillus alkalicola]|uniref:DUF1700 domain-containing protein n=2 Tax=Bacillales TaxID=1385 RepID=A0ABS6JTB0_9BACI|nr:hypothetical protein [Bacillus alkalicola]